MSPKRLCIVTHTFLPHVGGIERVVYEQAKRLMQRGFDVTVLTSRMRTPESYVVDGIKVRCYGSLNTAFGVGIPYVVPQITSFKTFLERVNENNLIHVHGHPYLSSLYAAKLANHIRKPVVLTQHNTFISYEGDFWDHVEWLNDAVVGKQNLKTADRIITVSDATKRYVLRLGANPARTTVIHNGVDVDRFKPVEAVRGAMRQKLGIAPDATVILSVRRLVYKNGIDTLVQSAKTAIKQDPKLVFLAVGTGPDANAIRAETEQSGIGGNFKLTGFVSDAELPAYYNAADLFVLPSKSGEGLPLVALEAMACGLPVIATNVGGISEILPEKFGRLIPPDNPAVMAEAVLRLSSMDRSSLKQEIRARTEAEFSWERNVEKLMKIYEELI